MSKSKIHIFKNSSWLDILEGDSYTSLVKPIRIETETKFKDKKGNLIFVANQESCLLDIDSRRIRKIDTINFPEDLEIDETLFERNYQRLNDTFDENDFVYEQKIYSQDIDFSKHVNNVIYVRFIMNSLSNDFLDNIDITDLEMHFIAESKEGQTLKIYKKELDNNVIRFLIKENDREIIRASIDYKNK